ncbi:MAG: ABC transporter permease, partial [Planctomycetes bacterium]|nr:ABC transporter permease [Planctomycetota bacterium]
VAATSFLIIAVSAFHLDPTGRLPARPSGDGGFALVGQSDQPVYHDLNTADGQESLGILPAEGEILAGSTTFPLRASSGDDASCLNLYQARQPRVLGVPPALIDRGGFDWAATAEGTDEENENPWRLLDRKLGTDDEPIIPVVIEKNTAMYALHKWKGVGEEPFELPTATGKPVRLQIVGLLNNGIFQGDLLIRESAFVEHFPEAGGYRFFLTELPSEGVTHERIEQVGRAMQTGLADQGMFVETTGDRLAGFLAVQNTYLSTFQSLGGLGLLLGIFGLAVVGWRNVLERRRELALMRAAGWRRRRLGRLVMIENGLLLIAGLAVGMSAALLAVLPHLLAGAASFPWIPLTVTIGGILIVGAMTGLAGVVAMTRAPLVAALRGD